MTSRDWHLPPRPRGWDPKLDNNLIACNFEPRWMGNAVAMSGSFYWGVRLRIPAGETITNIVAYVSTVGAGLTYARAAIYEKDGTRSGITADQSVAWTSLYTKVMPLGAPVAAKDYERDVWAVFCADGTTPPILAGNTSLTQDVGLPNPGHVSGYYFGAPPLPASLTPGIWTSHLEVWAGVS